MLSAFLISWGKNGMQKRKRMRPGFKKDMGEGGRRGGAYYCIGIATERMNDKSNQGHLPEIRNLSTRNICFERILLVGFASWLLFSDLVRTCRVC